MTANKDTAIAFLKTVVAGHIDEAYARYVAPGMRHHHPFCKGDAESLKQAMKENEARFPGKVFEIKRAIGEGDMVAVHSRFALKQGEAGFAVLHMMRFENGRIAEFWDMAQEIPADTPNENGML